MKLTTLLATAALLTGCGGDEETAPEPGETRRGARQCGAYENLNEPVTGAQREANRCILDALEAGEPATLVVTRATVEGDPIVTHITVHATDHVELVVDDTKDRFGNGTVETLFCTGLHESGGLLEGTDCEPA